MYICQKTDMNSEIRNLEPKELWNKFADLNAVPRPSNINPAGTVKKWAFKQARRALARYLNKADKHYIICLKSSAYGMVRRMQQAAYGL